MALSSAGLIAALSSWTDEVFLECLTVSFPASSPTVPDILLVNDRQNLSRTAGTFIAFPFRARLHARAEERIAEAEITADNVDQRLILALRGMGQGTTITYEVVMESAPNTVQQGPFEFDVKGFVADAHTVGLRISFALDFLNEAFPKDYFAPWNAS